MNTAIRRLLALAALALPLVALAQTSTSNPSDKDHAAKKEKFVEKMKATDTNGDHQLSKEEMSKGMPRLAAHFDEIDVNHDAKVSTEELKTYVQAHKGQRHQHGD